MRAAILLAAWSCLPAVVEAQVDPRGDWRTWHTDHFNVHAAAELAEIARTAASEAERAWAALSAELKPPRGTVELTLHDNVDFSNGFATVFPSNRISIFLTPPAGEVGLGRYDEWLRLVITHELTHIFHLDRSAGAWGLAQHVFGRAPLLFPNIYRPGWVLEGVATYYESRMTAGGRGRGAFHGQLLAAAAAADQWPNPGDANFSNSRWPGGLEPYAWGSRFFLWEAEAHGDSVMPRFIERTSHRLWPLTISGPLKNAGGAGLYPDWRSFRAAWDSAAASADNADTAAVIARGLRFEPKPRVSADGSRLAWVQADGKRRERIVVRDIARGMEVASQVVNGSPEISWAGDALLLSELDFTSPVEIRSGLFRWTPGRPVEPISGVRRLTRPFSVGRARVGAVRIAQGTTVLVTVDGDRAEPLPVPPADGWAHVSLSADGGRFAGARHARGQWDIAWWPIDAPGEVRVVTDDDALDDEPSWSSDGSSILFTSERAGMPQIFAYRVVEGTLTQLTHEPTGARDGGIAGSMLFFSTVLHDGYAVMSRPLDPSTPDPIAPAEPPAVLRPAEVQIRESRYSPWSSLAPRYWLPSMHDVGSTGLFLGAFTSGSDVVGRTSWAGGLAHATTNSRWEGYLSLGYTRWAAASLDATAAQSWDRGPRVAVAGALVTVPERDRVASLGITARRRRWRSDLAGRLGAEITQETYFVPPGSATRFLNPLLAGGVVSASAGRIHRQSESISPDDGGIVSGAYRRRWAIDGTGGSSDLRGTMRAYLGLPLPGFANWVLAARASAAMSGGRYARHYALGGESGTSYSLLPGVGFGGGFRDFGLRGYPPGSSVYTRAVAGVAELRIPLFLIGKAVGRLPLSLDRVSLSIYGEAAGGWTGAGPKQLARYRDAGAELVTDLGINLDAPLRVRVGAAQALSDGLGANKGDWRAYVALGSAF